MAWRKEVIEGGYQVWVNEPKPLLDSFFDHLGDSYSNRMGHLCQPKRLRLNLRSVVKCRKTERLEKQCRLGKKLPFWTKRSDYEESNLEDNTEYDERFYEEPPRKKSRSFGPAPRKHGLWR